jgi:CRP-like cAMP-binding protein
MLTKTDRQPFVRNTILASLPRPDLAAIAPFLEPFILKERMILQELKSPVEHIYFVESGVVSLRIVTAGCFLETAVTGYRGAIGVSFLLGGHIPTQQAIVLFPGTSLRIRSDDLRRLMGEHPQILRRLLRYVQALNIHSAQSALCGVRHELVQRLSCWLCVVCDARSDLVVPVTHDYLSTAMGLRRAGVTESLICLEEQGAIRKMRGVLQVSNRQRLEQRACGCYSLIVSAYAVAEDLASAR